MNWSQTINTLIFVLGTFGSILEGIHLARIMAQKLPEHTRVALEQFAKQAVQQVEQQYEKNPGKKALAQAAVATMFKAFNLPVPPAEAIDIAIEGAVFEINRALGEKPTELKAELKDAGTTN